MDVHPLRRVPSILLRDLQMRELDPYPLSAVRPSQPSPEANLALGSKNGAASSFCIGPVSPPPRSLQLAWPYQPGAQIGLAFPWLSDTSVVPTVAPKQAHAPHAPPPTDQALLVPTEDQVLSLVLSEQPVAHLPELM